MTTVAASVIERVMCSDTQWTDGDECGPVRKVYRIHGALVGFAGSLASALRWVKAYREGKKLPADDKTLSVMRLDQDGISTWTALDGWITTEQATWAIGTGGKAARAAMDAGATCRRAVRIVIDIDANSGGRVSTHRLKAVA